MTVIRNAPAAAFLWASPEVGLPDAGADPVPPAQTDATIVEAGKDYGLTSIVDLSPVARSILRGG